MDVNVKLERGASLPRHVRPGDAGMDLASIYNVTVFPGETAMVHTGVRADIPDGWCGLVLPRSGIASKRGLAPVNSPGLIDSNYRGEILVPLHNYNQAAHLVAHDAGERGTSWSLVANPEAIQEVEAGERVAQLVLVEHATCECVEVDELSGTERGELGFGSSGEKEAIR